MHDLDRIQMEFQDEWEKDNLEASLAEDDAHEPEYENESEYEYEYSADGVFDEEDEMALAAELLEVGDDEELEQFLGKIWRAAKRVNKKYKLTNRLKGYVKRNWKKAVRKALPTVGTAVGGFFGGPVGASLGRKLAPHAGKLLGLELEGLSPEDQEFEVARHLVRLGGESLRQAAMVKPGGSDEETARTAILKAARMHTPGLLSNNHRKVKSSRGRGGRWIWRNNNIIILGVKS